ncbi:MAG: hypothetical protein VX347_03195 [Bacteroidota bacterium]|nr:hypothetical protein [Bacteroidota bacterium]
MNKILKNITTLLMACFVLFVSIGLNVSKLKCGTNSSLYIGLESPSCTIDKEICSIDNLITSSCCSSIQETNCCHDEKIATCKTESVLIQYNFQTTITEVKVLIQNTTLFVQNIIWGFDKIAISDHLIYSCKKQPPPLLKLDLYIKIQSFLI